MSSTKPEVWLRGPIENISPMLQPIAHSLMQAREEVESMMFEFPSSLLWMKPGGVASVGFHLKHLRGVLDRLFTYAIGQPLNQQQIDYLKMEGTEEGNAEMMVQQFCMQVDLALIQLRNTDQTELSAFRGVGRAQLPSTVFGLLVHAAEHTMRHVGQLLVTVRILKNQE